LFIVTHRVQENVRLGAPIAPLYGQARFYNRAKWPIFGKMIVIFIYPFCPKATGIESQKQFIRQFR
jgi:hypothetical protein